MDFKTPLVSLERTFENVFDIDLSHFFSIVTKNWERFYDKEYLLIYFVLIALIIELVSRSAKRKMKRSIFAKYERSTDPKHAEFYLQYYRKGQTIDIIRVTSILVLVSFLFVTKTSAGINFFVIATGALIVSFKDYILSVVAFFILTRNYHIGNTIGIGDIQGQIIYIRMLSVGILGKDNDGDSTGKLFVIPSHRFITDPIRKEDLSANSIKKELLKIPFVTDEFTVSFSEFLTALETYLDDQLPTLSKKNTGNYQTYIGHKYKMDIDYLEEKCITLTVGLVGKWENTVEKKKKIVAFVESFRKR